MALHCYDPRELADRVAREPSIWRDPAEDSDDLYPGLKLHDGTVTGSIRCGGRLPLWAIVHTAVTADWDAVEDGWMPGEHYGYTADDLGAFLTDLLEARGEFGRLLLVLAGVEREANRREEDGFAEHMATVVHDDPHVCECGWQDAGPWWWQDDLRAQVTSQLERCLAALSTTSRER